MDTPFYTVSCCYDLLGLEIVGPLSSQPHSTVNDGGSQMLGLKGISALIGLGPEPDINADSSFLDVL